MSNIKPQKKCPELDKIQQSKTLKFFIKNRLYVLKMHYHLTEEEVLNHVSLEFWKTLQSDKKIEYPIAWARTVSERYIVYQFRKFGKTEPTELDKIEYIANSQDNANSEFSEHEELHSKIQQLKAINQKIIHWRFFEDLSWDRIAKLLSSEEGKLVTIPTARKRGERAINELQRKYCM
jgi:DNA-directed RNA polymerase specialized sigma24 family protein